MRQNHLSFLSTLFKFLYKNKYEQKQITLFFCLFVMAADMGSHKGQASTFSSLANLTSNYPSWRVHGTLPLPGASLPTFSFQRARVPKLEFLAQAVLPVHVWIYSPLEVLLHLVHLRGLSHYIRSWVHRLVWFFTSKTQVGPCQERGCIRRWACQELCTAATCLEYSSQYLAALL